MRAAQKARCPIAAMIESRLSPMAKKSPKSPKSGKKSTKQPNKAAAAQPKVGWRQNAFGKTVYWGTVGVIWGTICATFALLYLAHDMPDVENLHPPGIADPAIVVKGANGATLVRTGPVNGDWIPYSQIPDNMVRALLAIEDRSFFQHLGVDGKGLARAAYENVRKGRVSAGGSTITQQLAKNLFLTSRQTIKRKAQELLLAFWLERTFDKQEILELYLNRVYFGGGTYGIDAASRKYFGHGATALTVSESAMLAGLLKAPSRLAPHINPDGAWDRAKLVLGAMADVGALTEAAAERLAARPPQIRSDGVGSHVRHFTDWVTSRAVSLAPKARGRSLVIYTTLDPAMQRSAYEATARHIAGEGQQKKASEVALIAMDHDGAVRAMIGGTSYGKSQYNRAILAKRQPGSAFKLFAYLAAMESGLKPTDRRVDAPITIEGWSPKNYSGRHHGEMTIREAFARSVNTIAVQVAEDTGRERVQAMAKRLGITTPVEPIASLPLGTEEVRLVDLASAYASVASGGFSADAYAISEITSLEGEVLYRRPLKRPIAVLSRPVANQAVDMLTAVVAWGSGNTARIDRPAAGKTGTSQDSRDAVFVGFTSDITAAIWVGNDNGAPMADVTGGGLPARIWSDFMIEAHAGAPVRPLLSDAGLFERAAQD